MTRQPVVVIGSLPHHIQIDNVRADLAAVGLALDHLAARSPAHRLRQRPDRHRSGCRPPARLPRAQCQTRPADLGRHAGRVGRLHVRRGSPPSSHCSPRRRRTRSSAPTICSRSRRSTSCAGVACRCPMASPVGMDDTDIAEFVNPTLTSVDLGAARRAATAAGAAPRPPRRRRRQRSRPAHHRRTPLTIREST